MKPDTYSTSFTAATLNRDWLHIGKLVSINLVTGEFKYHDGYTPDEAAKIFWEALGRGMRK